VRLRLGPAGPIIRAMPAPDVFADLLTAKLQEEQRTWGSRPDACRTEPVDPVRGFGAYRQAQLGAGAAGYVELGEASHPHTPPATASSLNPAQRDALTAIRRLGARLADDFDASQLKAAFRRLALELHPDRHPDADSSHRSWLSTRFAVLCEAYRTLNEPLRS